LHAIESALSETYENAPLGSLIVPMPELPDTDATSLGRSFRGQRGRVLLRESVNVSAAGGPVPNADWKPADVTPDLQRALPLDALAAARGAICGAFGVLPALFVDGAQGPAIRECQRHLAQWVLQPIATLLAEEATAKLGGPVKIDVLRPTQSWDAGGRARAMAGIVEALAKAKESGISAADINDAWKQVAWE
jgi:hypothetical protein